MYTYIIYRNSFKTLFNYHLGSVALGSFILAVIKLLRTIVKDKKDEVILYIYI